jgi:hypothetical protein
MYYNVSGSDNIAIGQGALKNNCGGCQNVMIGSYAGYGSKGSCNIGIGQAALCANGTGGSNIAIGYGALQNSAGTYGNTAIGQIAGRTNTTGCNNTFLGFCALGLTATSCNTITLGNASITTIRAQVQTITSLSDCRDKTNICSIPVGLDFVRALRPVKFDWNMRDGAKVGIPEAGFIAQELDQVQQQFNVEEWLKLVLKENPDRLEATPGKLLPILVKAMQEMAQEIDQLRTEVNSLLGK